MRTAISLKSVRPQFTGEIKVAVRRAIGFGDDARRDGSSTAASGSRQRGLFGLS